MIYLPQWMLNCIGTVGVIAIFVIIIVTIIKVIKYMDDLYKSLYEKYSAVCHKLAELKDNPICNIVYRNERDKALKELDRSSRELFSAQTEIYDRDKKINELKETSHIVVSFLQFSKGRVKELEKEIINLKEDLELEREANDLSRESAKGFSEIHEDLKVEYKFVTNEMDKIIKSKVKEIAKLKKKK
jgi:hypothetical protein